jgi:hypothetical protein
MLRGQEVERVHYPMPDSTWVVASVDSFYAREFVVDTLIVQKYVHMQEIALFDSLGWWADGTDTVKIDPTLGNRIEVEDNNVTVFSVSEKGKVVTQSVVAKDSLRIGAETTTDNVVPALVMKGDADSDGTAVTPMTYTQTIVQNVTPTNAYMSNTLNQGLGYSFDKGIATLGAYLSSAYGLATNGTVVVSTLTTGSSSDGLLMRPSAQTVASAPLRVAPSKKMQSNVWDSSGTPVNKTQTFKEEVFSVSGGTVLPAPSASTARYSWSFNHNGGGGYSEIMSLYGDGTPAGKNGFANGEATFSSGASADTVTISGAATTDVYTFEWTSDPGTPGAVWFERKAGSFIVHTAGAVTATPSWMWTRRKTLN